MRAECFACEKVLEESRLAYRELVCGHKAHSKCLEESKRRGLTQCYICESLIGKWNI